MMPPEPTVTIDGDIWKLADFSEQITACRARSWQRAHWQRRPALVHRAGGVTSRYHGQSFDPAKIDLVPDGWNLDHCAICTWTLGASGDETQRIGYTDDWGDWVCTECYEQFLAPPASAASR